MKFFKKLNEIDVKEMADNLRNIDPHQIKENIFSKPHILINIAVVIITLVLVGHTFGKNNKSSKQIKSEIPILEDKLNVVTESAKKEKEYEEFMKTLQDSLPSDQIISKLSAFAVLNDVQILSFTPGKISDEDFLIMFRVTMEVSSDNYENIVNFVKTIEEAPFLIRVDRLKGEDAKATSRRAAREEEKSKIKLTIDINSLELKDV